MTDQENTKPQTTTGGPLGIREERVASVSSNAELSGKDVPYDPSRAEDVDTISENTDGDGQHKIRTEVDEATDLPQKGSA